METNIVKPNSAHNGRTMAGIIILIIGGMLLVDQLNIFFVPSWLFSWPMWIIGYGLYVGGKYNFRKPIWIWMVVLGSAFLFTENIDNADRFVWPVALIGLGVWVITKHQNEAAAQHPGNNYKEI